MKKQFCLLLLLCGLTFAQVSPTNPQQPSSPAQQPAPPAAPAQSPTPQASPQAQPQSTPSPNRLELEPEPAEKEHKITAAEAKELFQSVDEILRFASKDTGLPIKKKVKRAVMSREQVEKYIGDKFKDDADRIRFERSEL